MSFYIVLLILLLISLLFKHKQHPMENFQEYYPVSCYRDDTTCNPAASRERPTRYYGPGLLPYRYNLSPLVKGLPETKQPWLPYKDKLGQPWLPCSLDRPYSRRTLGKNNY